VNGQSATDSVRRSGGPTASLKPSEASEALKGAETLQRLLRGFSAILSGSTSAPPLRRYVREHAENRRLYPRRFYLYPRRLPRRDNIRGNRCAAGVSMVSAEGLEPSTP
jgi:hypothetical protein